MDNQTYESKHHFWIRRLIMNDDTTKKCTCGVIGVVVGGLIGAAVALLYAPQSGRETRKDIKRTARRVKNSTVDLIEDTIDDVNDLVNDLRKKGADILEQGADLSGKAKQDIIAILDQVQKAIEKKKQQFSETKGE
jgi:gas vesicle protein